MKNSDKGKVNKGSGRIRGDIIAVVFVLLIIAGYIFYECYSVTHVDVETITAVTSTVYETIEAKALVVRDEHIVKSSAGGVTVADVESGEKVKLGGNVAMVFSSEDNAKTYLNSRDLHSQLDYYIELENKAAALSADVASIDKDILNDANEYVRIINSGSYGKLSDCADDLNDKFARRQIIIGESVDFSQIKSDLQAQINNINIDSCKPTGYVKADESGIFSSYTDGCESMFDYKKIKDIDPQMLKDYMDKAKNTQPEKDCFGKLITSYEWYFCCVVPARSVKGLKNGDLLNVALKSSDDVIECQIVSGADSDLGAEETVLVLRSSHMNSQIASMRLEDIEIRYSEYTGFKVPSSAIHVDEKGNKCVYALISNQVAKREGEIIYTTKDYVVFKNDSENSNTIRFYDQIITKGTDLYDGKVYS